MLSNFSYFLHAFAKHILYISHFTFGDTHRHVSVSIYTKNERDRRRMFWLYILGYLDSPKNDWIGCKKQNGIKYLLYNEKLFFSFTLKKLLFKAFQIVVHMSLFVPHWLPPGLPYLPFPALALIPPLPVSCVCWLCSYAFIQGLWLNSYQTKFHQLISVNPAYGLSRKQITVYIFPSLKTVSKI